MLDRLAKLASFSARLRQAVLQKEGGALTTGAKLLGKGTLTAGKLIKNNPGKALTVGLGGMSGMGSFRQHKAGFKLPPGTL